MNPWSWLVAQAASSASASRSWTPFLDPLPIHAQWWLTIIPMAFFVCVAYKAVRCVDMSQYWRQVFVMTGQTIAGMIGLAVLMFAVVEVVVPRLG